MNILETVEKQSILKPIQENLAATVRHWEGVLKRVGLGKIKSATYIPNINKVNKHRPIHKLQDMIDHPRKCLRCDTGTMILRNGKFGRFFGCSNYPKCENTLKGKYI